jgi:DNA recombination protein RmuC
MDFAVIILGLALVVAAAILAFALTRPKPSAQPDPRLDTLLARQGEVGGQFTAAVAAQETLARTLGERLEALEKRVGDGLSATAKQTGETFVSITERLSVIDAAQKNISELSTHVISLKAIFSDKQARGAVAQDQLESIVSEHLAPDQYEFQAKLTNGKIVDCAIRIPNVPARIVADAKFPHEAFKALSEADTEEARKAAMVQVRTDVQKHVKDIAEKYLIPGETQTPAIMFVPSDSMYAEMHANFPETLRRARQSQVIVASPHVFMLIVSTLQSLMRDAKMREHVHAIQKEIGVLLKDIHLLSDRVGDLRTHFEKTSKDIGEIEKPMARITVRAERIERAEIGNETPPALLKD